MEDAVPRFGPGARLIHEMFEEQACRCPDAVAVSCKGQTLTYRELSSRANKLARFLLTEGARPDSRIAICVERSLEMVVGLLGILKAGAAYVPLDPSYPAERLRHILDDCKPVALLTQEHLRTTLSLAGIRPIMLDADWSAIQGVEDCGDGECPIELTSENLAYVIYTSGSTGTPKGVMVEHRNVMQFLVAVDHCHHFGRDNTWALFHSFAFDVSVVELWGALLSGARLIIVSYATSRFPIDLCALLRHEAVTVLCQTPSAFVRLIGAQAECSSPLPLKTIILAGEALQLPSIKRWYERSANHEIRLANMYGPTETTVYVTCHLLKSSDEDPHGGSVIGTALANSRISILDENRKPLPAGALGEIHIGGAGVARGYLNRPVLTAERFIADSTGSDGARVYRSGDLGVLRGDGSVEYRGRNDSQVKVRGFRIELGDVESHLAAVEGVREAVVVVREESNGEARLVAYLTEDTGVRLTAFGLRAGLLQRLPVHMVPTTFVILPQLPLNGSGKIDRKMLPIPEPANTKSMAVIHASSKHLLTDGVTAQDSFDSAAHSTATTPR